ncbi:MAG: hypothetical protein CM1200mP32_05410 [Methanobacteriota archaeon]|nr:MAG: hypothetical protein CM1200mP32_05410 [Euryarchaeota archaeon]
MLPRNSHTLMRWTKYLEARTAYLELVTLQAQNKKQEILDGSSEE